MSNNSIEIKNGKLVIPYTANEDKIVVAAKDSSGKLVGAKTFKLKKSSSKPTLSISITPIGNNHFICDQEGNVKNSILFNTNYIIDGAIVYNSDFTITSLKEDYNVNILSPSQIELQYINEFKKIDKEFSDIIPLKLKCRGFEYDYNLSVEFVKGVFDITSSNDTLSISKRSTVDTSNEILVDMKGYFNEVSVNKELLDISLDGKEIGKYIKLLGDVNVIKRKDNNYLTYSIKGEDNISNIENFVANANGDVIDISINKTIIDNTNNIKIKDKKVLDISGNVYYNDVSIVDNSSGVISYNNIKIDASNWICNNTVNDVSILDGSGNVYLEGNIVYDSSNKYFYAKNSSTKIAEVKNFTDNSYNYNVYNGSVYYDSSNDAIMYNNMIYCASNGDISLYKSTYNKNDDSLIITKDCSVDLKNKKIYDGSIIIDVNLNTIKNGVKTIIDVNKNIIKENIKYNLIEDELFYGNVSIIKDLKKGISNAEMTDKSLSYNIKYYDIEDNFYPIYKNDDNDNKITNFENVYLLINEKVEGINIEKCDTSIKINESCYFDASNKKIYYNNIPIIYYIDDEEEITYDNKYIEYDKDKEKYYLINTDNNDIIINEAFDEVYFYGNENKKIIKSDNDEKIKYVILEENLYFDIIEKNIIDTDKNEYINLKNKKFICNNSCNAYYLLNDKKIQIDENNIISYNNGVFKIKEEEIKVEGNNVTLKISDNIYKKINCSNDKIYFNLQNSFIYELNGKKIIYINESYVSIDSEWNLYHEITKKPVRKNNNFIYCADTSIFNLNTKYNFIINDSYIFDVSNKVIKENNNTDYYIKFSKKDNKEIHILDLDVSISNDNILLNKNIKFNIKDITYILNNNDKLVKNISDSKISLDTSKYYCNREIKDNKISISIKDTSVSSPYLFYQDGTICDSSNKEISNTNKDRLFYYFDFDNKEKLLKYNNNVVKIIEIDNNYYDVSSGKLSFLKNNDHLIDCGNNKLFEKEQLLNKYNNIIIDEDYSYNIVDKTYRDKNNAIITTTPNIKHKVSLLAFDGSFYYNSNGRKICDGSINNIYIDENIYYNNGKIYYDKEEVKEDIKEDKDKGVIYYNNKIIVDDSFVYDNRGNKIYDKNKKEVYDKDGKKLLDSSYYYLSNGYKINLKDKTIINENDDVISEEDIIIEGIILKDEDNNIYNIYDVSLSNNELKVLDSSKNIKNIVKYLKVNDNTSEVYDIYKATLIPYVEHNEHDVYYKNIHKKDYVLSQGIADILTLYKKYNYANNVDTKLYFNIDYNNVKSIATEDFLLVDNGVNKSNYSIYVTPEILTSMSKDSSVIFYIVNDKNEQVEYKEYFENGYKLKYSIDYGVDKEVDGDKKEISGKDINNNIIIRLYNGESVVEEEIVELLGENKYITSVEYINTDKDSSYTISPIKDIHGNNIDWMLEKNSLEGVSLKNNVVSNLNSKIGTIVLKGLVNGVKKYEKSLVLVKNGPQGAAGVGIDNIKSEQDSDGNITVTIETSDEKSTNFTIPKGETGEMGRMIYPAGNFNSSTKYTIDGKTSPYVFDVSTNKYYVLINNYNGDTTPSLSNSTYWKEMNQYSAIYTEMLIADFGKVGSAVFCGDYMFSQYGYVFDGNGGYRWSSEGGYKHFGTSRKNITETIKDISVLNIIKQSKFVPSVLIDFKTGDCYFGLNGDVIIGGRKVTIDIFEGLTSNIQKVTGYKNAASGSGMQSSENLYIYTGISDLILDASAAQQGEYSIVWTDENILPNVYYNISITILNNKVDDKSISSSIMLPYIDGDNIKFYRKIVSGCKANILFKPEFGANNTVQVVNKPNITSIYDSDGLDEHPDASMSCSVVKGQYWLLNEISPILLQDYENVSE